MPLTDVQIESLRKKMKKAFKHFYELVLTVKSIPDTDQLWEVLESETPEDFQIERTFLIDDSGCAINPIREIRESLSNVLDDESFKSHVAGLGNTLSSFWTEFWQFQFDNCNDQENMLLNRIKEENMHRDGFLTALKEDTESAEDILEKNEELIALNNLPHIAPFDQWNWREFRNRLEHSKICRNTGDIHLDRDRDDLPEFLFEALYSPGYWKVMKNIKMVHEHISKCYLVMAPELLEDSDDTLKDCLKIFLAEARENEEQDNRWSSDREVMLEGLKALDWQPGEHYVECLHSSRASSSGRVSAIEELTRQVGGGGKVVEIHGVGGVGKTILAYRYVWDNLNGVQRYRHVGLDKLEEIEPFWNVIFLSSKGKDPERQGMEFSTISATTRLEKATSLAQRKEKVSTYYYGFENFLRKVGYQVNYRAGESDRERAWRALTEKRFLVVVDNFEDYIDKDTRSWNSDGERFKEFLDSYQAERGKSTILVTSRTSIHDELNEPIASVKIDGLDTDELRFRLVQKRAEWLAKNALAPMTTRMTNLYQGRPDSSKTRTNYDEQRLAWRNLEQSMGTEFANNLTHPQVIMIFTKELMDKMADPNIGDIEDAVKEICATGDNASYTDAIKEHDEWIMERSISKHVGTAGDPETRVRREILMELYRRYPNPVAEVDLSELELECSKSVIYEEIKKIYADSIMIERESDTDTREIKVRLLPRAKRVFDKLPDFEHLRLDEEEIKNITAMNDHEKIAIVEDFIKDGDYESALQSLEQIVKKPNISTRRDLDPANLMRACRVARTLGDYKGRGNGVV